MSERMIRVSEIMSRGVIYSTSRDVPAMEAARLMSQTHKGCLVVVEGARPVGIVTERDFVHRVIVEGLSPFEVKVSEIMSTPLITIGPEALISDAAKIMSDNAVRRLPVVEDAKIIGIITASDFAKYLLRKSGYDPMLAAMARAAALLPQTI